VSRSKDAMDRYFDYDVHLESRTLYLGPTLLEEGEESHTNSVMAERAIKGLHVLSMGPKGAEEITIKMNNWGGDWWHGMAIYDAIKECPAHVTVMGYGYVMSMGSIIMQAADSRIMMPNANMMIHDGTEHLNGHCRNVEAWAAHAKKVRHIMYKIYADRSGKSVPYWSKRCVIDLILSAEEAVEIGLADKVWKPDSDKKR
jgi:ATP-dependent Clp endopeptidase proteolytic subunit ClpP